MITPPLDILEAVYKKKREKIKVWPCHTNRASELGHPCLRYLVYKRTHWDKSLTHDVETEFIFEAGRRIEEEAIDELKDAGFDILEQQRSYQYPEKELNITGHIDLKIAKNSQLYPVEIKGLNHYDFVKLNTIDDFLNSNKFWIKKYPAQLTLYMLMSDCELGLFYLKDKQTHIPKVVWMELDYEYAESLLQKAKLINKHVENDTLPDKTELDETTCNYCSFKHICLPNIDFGQGCQVVDNERLEEMLNRRAELEEAAKEFAQLDKKIKEDTKGKDIVVGNYRITGKWYERTKYNIPNEVKSKYAEKEKYWRSSIIKIM